MQREAERGESESRLRAGIYRFFGLSHPMEFRERHLGHEKAADVVGAGAIAANSLRTVINARGYAKIALLFLFLM